MTIRAAVSQKEMNFTETEKKIADYIMENGDSIAKMNSTELSNAIGTSQSSIIKFVKKIGMNSFTDFKVQLHHEFISTQQVDSLKSQNTSLEDDIEDVVKAIYQESIDSMYNTMINIDMEAFKTSIQLIEKAGRIYICGKGASFLPAQDLASKLMKFGMTAICIQDLETMALTAVSAKENDIFIFFTFSGETIELIKILQGAKDNHSKIITVTKNAESTIGSQSTICLQIVTNEPKHRAASMSSRIVFFSIVDILYLGVLKNDLKKRLRIIA